jgi:hypothetical protein
MSFKHLDACGVLQKMDPLEATKGSGYSSGFPGLSIWIDPPAMN